MIFVLSTQIKSIIYVILKVYVKLRNRTEETLDLLKIGVCGEYHHTKYNCATNLNHAMKTKYKYTQKSHDIIFFLTSNFAHILVSGTIWNI